ncbi:MAG: S8 family serine peptidase [Thermoleophilia bacterium]
MRRAVLTAASAALAAAALAPAAHGALVSQGGVRMGTDALWSRGALGQQETVAILDEGFAGLDRSIALGELPSRDRLTIRLFDPASGEGGQTEFGVPTQHGVRMAELVHDLAPQARLVLVGYRTQDQFAQAAAWIAAEGIPVVSHSNSFLTPPFDGTGPAARAVDAAAAAGVLWVNSAGNYAQRHWRGTTGPEGTVIPVAPAAGTPMLFSLTWTAPGVTATLALERQDATGAWVEVQRAAAVSPVNAQTTPVVADGGAYRLVARVTAGGTAPLDLWSQTVGFGPLAVADGSIPTPGDAAGSLTVGAVKWTGTAREPYSSAGPTADGRMKPDLVGPTYVTSNPEWPGTAGTSAATAHVAAAAVLLRQARRAAGLPVAPADIRQALAATALDLGAPGPDTSYGAGMARVDADPPALLVRVSGGARRVVRVRSADAGTIRRVRIAIDGRGVRSVGRPRTGVRLRALSPGTHRLEVVAEDMAGNITRRVRTLRGAPR